MAITKQVYLWELYGDGTYQSVTNPSDPYVNAFFPNAGEGMETMLPNPT